MCEITVILIGLFLACVGASCLLGRLWVLLNKPKKRNEANCIIVLNGNDDLLQIQYYTEKYKWFGSDFADKIFFVCNEETSKKYLSEWSEYENIYFGTMPQIVEKIS